MAGPLGNHRTRSAAIMAMVVCLGCSHGPPPGLAPDPSLVARIQGIEIVPTHRTVCPGQRLGASYLAILDDGSRIPFERRYDRDNPPQLHVIMLNRTSPDAQPLEGGDWRASRDPMATVMSGFRLNAFLRADASLNGATVVEPAYSCVEHGFVFSGRNGGRGETGENGPDVTVRLGVLASPFYGELLVAGVEVGEAMPYYVVYDADMIPPADWLTVESRGGRGGRGERGEAGAAGRAGASGCPGRAGAPGGAGGAGGPGGAGGRGGDVTIVVPAEDPFLAGLVEVRNRGGRGGAGGAGGPGGRGGEGGAPSRADCQRGAAGPDGADGPEGRAGRQGSHGPRPTILEVPAEDVFGPRIPARLQELIDYSLSS